MPACTAAAAFKCWSILPVLHFYGWTAAAPTALAGFKMLRRVTKMLEKVGRCIGSLCLHIRKAKLVTEFA